MGSNWLNQVNPKNTMIVKKNSRDNSDIVSTFHHFIGHWKSHQLQVYLLQRKYQKKVEIIVALEQKYI